MAGMRSTAAKRRRKAKWVGRPYDTRKAEPDLALTAVPSTAIIEEVDPADSVGWTWSCCDKCGSLLHPSDAKCLTCWCWEDE